MESDQIKYFLQVAEDLNFTKASEHLFVSQSSVSKKISSLEKELGFTLLKRNHQMVKLTENGKRFVKFFQRIEKEFYEESSKAKYFEYHQKKTLKLGIISNYDFTKLASFLNPIKCDFQLDFANLEILLKGLNSFDYDLIIGQFKGIQQEIKNNALIDSIECVKLCEINRYIFFAKNNPLAQKKDLKLKDFASQNFYIGSSLVALQNAEEICMKENINPKLISILHNETIEYELLKGDGFTLGDECNKFINHKDLDFIKIDYKQILGCAYLKDIELNKYKLLQQIIRQIQKNNNSKME